MSVEKKPRKTKTAELKGGATFSLKLSTTLSEIHSKYKLNVPVNITNIVDEIEPSSISFHDEFRRLHRCCVSKIDFSSSKTYCCFWDRHSFTTAPIGCPISYKPMVVTRTFNSEISKDTFVVKESISRDQNIECGAECGFELVKKQAQSYYETDGIFCSFNCALAFAFDKRNDPIYSQSVTLLNRMRSEFTSVKGQITPASSWRVLKEYGGTETIEKFRNNFDRVDHEFKGIHRVCFKPVGFLFEERIKL